MYVDFKSDYKMETYKVKKKIINSKFRVPQWIGVEDNLELGRNNQKSSKAMVISFFNSDGDKDVHHYSSYLIYIS